MPLVLMLAAWQAAAALPGAEQCSLFALRNGGSEGSQTTVRLDYVRCQSTDGIGKERPYGQPLPSPDGRHYLVEGGDRIEIGTFGRGRTVIQTGPPSRYLAHGDFRWDASGNFVWGREQPKQASGWTKGPVQLFRYFPDGHKDAVPAPLHPAGPLDDIQWIGSHGLALAQYGSLGRYWRPEHADENPTLAWIDAGSGKVLQSLSMKNLPWARSFSGSPMIPTWRLVIDEQSAEPTVLFQWPTGPALIWRPGTPPEAVPRIDAQPQAQIAVDRARKHILIAPLLKVAYIAECNDDEKCDIAPPETGPVLKLIDMATRQERWSISETVGQASSPRGAPVFSPSGRLTLFPVPALSGSVCLLIDNQHGAVLVRIRCSVTGVGDQYAFDEDEQGFRIVEQGIVRHFRLH